VAAVTLLGLILRLPGLGVWWLNPDEGLYYSMATWPAWSQFWAEVAANAHPPLFGLVIRSASFVSLEVGALRAPAFLCGVLAIPALHLATRALAGPAAGLAAALLVAWSPAALIQSQLVRPYTMQLAVLALGLWLLARGSARGAARDPIGWGALALVAVLLHYSSVLALAACAGALLILAAARVLRPRELRRWALALVPAALAAAGLWWLHVSPRFVGAGAQSAFREEWLRPFFPETGAALGAAFVGLFRYWFGPSRDALALLVFAGGLLAACLERRVLLAALVVLGFAGASGLSLLGIYPLGASRHSLYLMVFAIPCMANGVRFLAVGRSWRHALGAALLVLLALHPQPLRSALRLTRVPEAAFAEQVVARRSIEELEPLLREARSREGLVVVDWQSYSVLVPYFHPDRVRQESLDDQGISLFRWGEARVLASHTWRLRTGPQRPGSPDHVFGFLAHADAALPELGLSARRELRVFLAGWGDTAYASLGRADRALGPEAPCVSELVLRTGVVSARLDPALCLEKLGRRGPRPAARRPSAGPGESGPTDRSPR